MPARLSRVMAIAAVLSLPVPQLAGAATKTGTFLVSAVVVSDCDIRSTPNLAFGEVGAISQPVDVTTVIIVACTAGTPYTIALNPGDGTGSTVADRRMSNGTNTLKYQLYSDAARTAVWPQTVGTDTVGATGNGNDQERTIYGRMPPQTMPAAGTYQSQVTVTVQY